MTLRRVNLGVFSASTRIFMNCDPLSSMAKAHRCNILADCHIGGTDKQKLFFRFFFHIIFRLQENSRYPLSPVEAVVMGNSWLRLLPWGPRA